MIGVIRKNKLLIIILGLSLIASIVVSIIILSSRNATKVPLRGVFVNETHLLQEMERGADV